MLMLHGPQLLFLLLMFFSNKGKSENDIPKVAIAEKIQDDSYCATFDETNGKCYNVREKRSLLDENTTTKSAVPLGSTEANNETVTNMEVNTDLSISSNTSMNISIIEANLSTSDRQNSSTEYTTVITVMEINFTNSIIDTTENILNATNVPENCSILLNETADNSTDIQNATHSESTQTNNEFTLNGENYTESDSRTRNSSLQNYTADFNNTVNAEENLVLTNLTTETHTSNVIINYTSEMFTTEETHYSTTIEGNARSKREIQKSVTDENKSNGSIAQNSTESDSVNSVEYNNVTNLNITLLRENYSEFNFTNSTESTIPKTQSVPLNSSHSDYNTTENADSIISSTDFYTYKSETNITDFELTTRENYTTNFTDKSIVDMKNTKTENFKNITETERIKADQNQDITNNVTNNLTESISKNLTIKNTMDGTLQNVSDENERLTRGIVHIVIRTAQNATNMNTTSNITDAAEHDLTESSPIMSIPQSTLLEAEKQTEKACLIQGEECTNSTECCEHFECTMFDFIKWSKNCDFKPEDVQLTSPPPDVRIPKQPIQLQPAL